MDGVFVWHCQGPCRHITAPRSTTKGAVKEPSAVNTRPAQSNPLPIPKPGTVYEVLGREQEVSDKVLGPMVTIDTTSRKREVEERIIDLKEGFS